MFLSLQPHTKAAIAEFQQIGLLTKQNGNLFFDASGHVKSMGDVINILRTHLATLNPVQRQAALNTMFSTYALSGMTVVAGTTAEHWAALQKSMSNTQASEVAAQKMNNLQGHLKEFTSTLQTIGTSMATFMLPAIDKIVQKLQGLAGVFKDLSPGMQHAILITGGLTAGLLLLGGTLATTLTAITFTKPGWEMLGGWIGNAKKSIVSFATETVPEFITSLISIKTTEKGVAAEGSLVTFLGNLGTGLKAITVDPIVKSFGLLQTAMKAETWTALGDKFVGTFTTMGSNAKTAVTGMVESSVAKMAEMKTAMSAMTLESVGSGFMNMLKGFGGGLLTFGRSIGSFLLGPWGLLLSAVVLGVTLIVTHWQQISDWVKQHFGTSIPQIVDHLKTDIQVAFNFMGKVVSDAWNAIKSATQAVWSYIGPTIIKGLQDIQKWWKSIWPELSSVLKVVFGVMAGLIGALLLPAFIVIKTALSALASDWHNIWSLIVDVLRTAWDAISSVIRVALDIIGGVIRVALDLLTGHFSKAFSDAKTSVFNIFTDMKNGVGKIVDDLGSVVMDAVKSLVGGVTGVFSGLVSTVKGIWNSITGIFSQKVTAPQVDMSKMTSTASTLGATSNPKIPHFAVGGLVTKPTIGLIGEAGPELVVPLNGINQSSSNYRMGLSGVGAIGGNRTLNFAAGSIVINVAKGDGDVIAKQLKIQLSRAI